jgi:hypothetical protein
MKEMIFLSAAPDDLQFLWQYEVFVDNVRGLGYENEIRILLFLPYDRLNKGWNPRWLEFAEAQKDNNVKVYLYADQDNFLNKHIRQAGYVSLLRPHILAKHFLQFPELKDKAIFYHDSDIVFTKYLDFTSLLDDDICYLSNTNGYINSDYFDRKFNECKPGLEEDLKKIDPMARLAESIGITRQICEANKENSGGAQYLLKNVDGDFWVKVVNDAKMIKIYLAAVNDHFFESENKGYQSWCADMWAVLWNLWATNHETKVVKELDFAWATDPIEKWDQVNIFHNAGVTHTHEGFFNKSKQAYVNNELTPFDDVEENNFTKEFCTHNYVNAILKTKENARRKKNIDSLC